jgi:glucose/arabinose dehydrogenase
MENRIKISREGIALRHFALGIAAALQLARASALATPVAVNTNVQIRLILNAASPDAQNSVRIARDPRNNQLYYSKLNGDVYQLTIAPGSNTSTSVRVYTSTNHGLSQNVQGMAIGPDGTIYLVGNTPTNSGNSTIAQIVKGVPNGGGGRTWSLLARTDAYPFGNSGFDHLFNGIIVSPDGNDIYVNSGARTDHGEVQSDGGLYPGVRDVPLTAKIFRLPSNGVNLFLTNDFGTLQSAGYIFAQGVRNAFDFAFDPDGKLFAIDNGPDRDMSDELNWLRAGLHYGFPWRMGGLDNPQQFAGYNPTNDPLLDPRFFAVERGYYQNDPTFPPPPTNFAEPVINVGPDADSFRDPTTGAYKDASNLGTSINTFTAHRAPLGLVFDVAGAMAPPFRHHGFVLGFTAGDPTGTNAVGPFFDPGQDLLDLSFTQLGATNFQVSATRVAGGFNLPVDAEIIGNRIYVLEYGGNQGIWELTFPESPFVLTMDKWPGDGTFHFTVSNAVPGVMYQILTATNLPGPWTTLATVTATNAQYEFVDPAASNHLERFYRVAQ